MGTPTQLSDKTGRVVFEGTQAGGGGSSPVLLAQKYLDHAAILALPTTSIALAPSPGPTKVIVPQTALLYCDTSAGAYTNISEGGELGPCTTVPGDFLNYLWEASAFSKVSSFLGGGGVSIAAFGPQAESEIVFGQGAVLPVLFQSGFPLDDQPLILRASNDGDYAEGDPANFMVVTVTYSILDLTAP